MHFRYMYLCVPVFTYSPPRDAFIVACLHAILYCTGYAVTECSKTICFYKYAQ
jgi:hypothetical protein